MLTEKIIGFLKDPLFMSIFSGISSDPSPPSSWSNIYKNIYFRFIFIFIIIYQVKKDIKSAVIVSIGSMIFNYSISNKEERQKMFTNNHNKEDLNTIIYFCIFATILYKIESKYLNVT